MTAVDRLLSTAARVPDNPALQSGTTIVADYRAFADQVACLGTALRSRFGIVPDDRVAIYAANTTDYLVALYGIWHAGAIAVPINAKLHPLEAEYILDHAQARLVFTGSGATLPEGRDRTALPFADGLPQDTDVLPPIRRAGDDLAWLFYTSGTTGKPKGVALSFANIDAMSGAYTDAVDDVRETDAAFYAAPMSHGAGLYNFMFVAAGSRHIVPPSGGFDADEICDLAPQLRDLSMFAAPTMIKRLIAAAKRRGYDGDGIRSIIYGGGPMYVADIIEATAAFGDRFIQIYGQGECPMCLTVLTRAEVADRTHPDWQARLASVGRAQPCVTLRTIRPDGSTCPPGEVGEIAARGVPVMTGYWQNPTATADTIRDGWLMTGDMGSLDEDGYLTLHDRSKDVIITGGSNVYPREVEEALLLHDNVAEVSVVGRPSAEWGEEVVAFVVAADGTTPDFETLKAHCRTRIAAFKLPKAIYFCDDLPKNNYGKVLKTELRDRLKTL